MPGLDIRNVHVAYDALLFWVVPSTHSAMTDVRFDEVMVATGDRRGVELLPGTLQALRLVLRSHRPLEQRRRMGAMNSKTHLSRPATMSSTSVRAG